MKRESYQNLFLTFTLLLITLPSYSQADQSKFLVKKNKNRDGEVLSHLLSGPYDVEIARPKRTKSKTYERAITTSNGNYNFVLSQTDGKGTLFNSEGQAIGTFLVKGKTRYDITMSDGTVYDWREGKSSRQWMYLVNGKEVVVCTFAKEGDKKYLQYDIKDASAKDLTTAITAAHIYGVDLIASKAKAPIIWITAISVGVISAVASSGSSPSSQ